MERALAAVHLRRRVDGPLLDIDARGPKDASVRAAFSFSLLVLVGCSNLGPRASLSLGCPESQVSLDGVTATGCGRTDVFHSDDGQWVSLRERAAFDLDCARDSLEVVPLTAETFGVTAAASGPPTIAPTSSASRSTTTRRPARRTRPRLRACRRQRPTERARALARERRGREGRRRRPTREVERACVPARSERRTRSPRAR